MMSGKSFTVNEGEEKDFGLFDLLMKKTFYGQFVAGDDASSLKETVRDLEKENIRPMIACMMEDDEGGSEKVHDKNLDRTLDCLRAIGSFQNVHPKIQTKLTGLMSPKLLAKLGSVCKDAELNFIEGASCSINGERLKEKGFEFLSKNELRQLEAGIARLRELKQNSAEHSVDVVVDAEYTAHNPGIRLLALAMMTAANRERAHIWFTYQCYLKSAFDDVSSDLSILEKFGRTFAAKIVRGAYMDRERELAAERGRESPIASTYRETSSMYSKVSDYLVDAAADSNAHYRIMIATHNEAAILHAIQRIYDQGLQDSEKFSYGQLMGMCDHVTHTLAKNGLTVYKSMPYGTVGEVLPYLYRRAMENYSVLERTTKERTLMKDELKARLCAIK